MKNDIHDVKSELGNVKNDIHDVKSDIHDVKSELHHVKSQLNENTEIIKAILHRQEETDAILDQLTVDVHQLHGEMTKLKKGQQDVQKGQKEILEEMEQIKIHVKYNTQKITETEIQVFKLKNQ